MRHTLGEFRDHDDDHLELVAEDREDAYYRPDRRLPMIALAVAAMAVFAGGLWFAYYQGTRHPAAVSPGDTVPLLRADERPAKVRPDQPGGMAIPDQNVSLYNDKPGAPPVEKLLPAAEQPLPRPVAPPKEIAAAMPPAMTPAPPQAVPAPAAPATTQTAKPAAKAAAKPAQPAATPVKAPAGTGPIQLRLASLKTPDEARDEWARLKRENPDILGKLTAVAVKTDLGDKGVYYRIQAGSFSDAAAAEKLCSELKRRKLGCILAR